VLSAGAPAHLQSSRQAWPIRAASFNNSSFSAKWYKTFWIIGLRYQSVQARQPAAMRAA
jgi:hypothetical protein